MRYSKIKKCEATNWNGINTTIFFTGCTFKCPGCFNEEIQDFNAGEILTKDRVNEFISYAESKFITGMCILGGEPFQQDLDELYNFIYTIKKEVGKPIHVWTGFTYEDLIQNEKTRKILYLIDTLVDGLFIMEKKDINLKYRGSSNQRVIDVKESLCQNKIILIDTYDTIPNHNKNIIKEHFGIGDEK